jgi:hypothetical protein
VALIFNFIFAKLLVGTKITRKDVLGTCVVVASVIWIVVFGGMYNGDDRKFFFFFFFPFFLFINLLSLLIKYHDK